MKFQNTIILFLVVFNLTILVSAFSVKADDNESLRLAKHYSPIIYQHFDVGKGYSLFGEEDTGLGGKSDLISGVDFDGAWQGNKKWENLQNFDGNATIYYSVLETDHYWFIYYAIYHARDWSNVYDETWGQLTEHKNDMEAVTFMVAKGAGFPGNLIAAMSMSHNAWIEYPISTGITHKYYNGNSDKNADGVTYKHNSSNVQIQNDFVQNGHHPRIYIQSKGHGIFMDADSNIFLNAGGSHNNVFFQQAGFSQIDNWNITGFPSPDGYFGTGIVYYCSNNDNGEIVNELWDNLIDTGGEQPLGADVYEDRWVGYRLEHISVLWDKRSWKKDNTIGQQWLFVEDNNGFDAFWGPKFGNSEAHPPWSMPDQKVYLLGPLASKITPTGQIFYDPLTAFPEHFDNIGDLSQEEYVDNPFFNTNASTISSFVLVDHSQSNGSILGEVISTKQYSLSEGGFLEAVVEITNTKKFWTKILLPIDLSVVKTISNSPYAKFGYLPPDGVAEFTIRYYSNVKLPVQFGVDATKESGDEATLLNLIQILITTIEGLSSAQGAIDPENMIEVMSKVYTQIPKFVEAADQISRRETFNAAITLINIARDDEVIELLADILTEGFSFEVSKEMLLQVFKLKSIYKILEQVMDQAYTFLFENPAGYVSFIGMVQQPTKEDIFAYFEPSPQSASINHQIIFDASSCETFGDAIDSYHWSFGDGSEAEQNTPIIQHHYANSGYYLVELTIHTQDNMTASSQVSVTVGNVHEGTPEAYLPSLPVPHSVQAGINPQNVRLSWDESVCALCEDIKYNIEVHDQSGQTVFKLDDNEKLIRETAYTLPTGLLAANTTYYWAVFPQNEFGIWNTEVGDWAQFTTGSTNANMSPVAIFTINQGGTSPSLMVTVDAAGSYDPEGEGLEYSWNWGDGSSQTTRSEQTSETHLYANSGRYAICLSAWDNQNNLNTSSKAITIEPSDAGEIKPDVYFISGPTGTTNESRPKFRFASSSRVAGYFRVIDNKSAITGDFPDEMYFNGSNIYQPTLSKSGEYKVYVRSRDYNGNLSDIVFRSFKYEKTEAGNDSAVLNRIIPAESVVLAPGSETTIGIVYTNYTNFDWKSYETSSNYVELRSVSFNGAPNPSYLYPGDEIWIDNSKERVVTADATNVAGKTANENAWYYFTIKVPDHAATGQTVPVYFQLYNRQLGNFGEISHLDVVITDPGLTVSGLSDKIYSGGTLSLQASGNGFDTNTVVYHFSTNKGTFTSPHASSATWTAPVVSQVTKITITVSARDSQGASFSETYSVMVWPLSNISGDTTGPSLNVSSPIDGAYLFIGEGNLIAYAVSDTTEVSHLDIQFKKSCNNPMASMISSNIPPSFNQTSWIPQPDHATDCGIIEVIATDNSGNTTSIERRVKIVDPISNPASAPPDMPEVYSLEEITNDGTYTLKWEDVAGADHYIIKEGHNGIIIEMQGDGQPQKAFTKTENGRYYYRVKAVNSQGESEWGGPAKIEVDIIPNEPPEQPIYRKPENDQIEVPVKNVYFDWIGNDPDSYLGPSYRIRLGSSPNNLYIVHDYADDGSKNEWYIHNTTLNANTNYYWQIIARDDDGAEISGPISHFRTAPRLNFDSPVFEDSTLQRLPQAIYNSQSISVIDIDMDGDQDIFEINAAVEISDPTAVFYINDGTGQFSEQRVAAFPMGIQGVGASWADFDNDGDKDVVIWFWDRAPILYRNDGNLVFVDVSTLSGIVFNSTSVTGGNTCAWADKDSDGDVDLYCSWNQSLFENNGEGIFVDVSETTGFSTTASEFPWGSAWFDFDNDGDMDLLTVGGQDAAFYENLGDGSFDKDGIPMAPGSLFSSFPRDHLGIAVGDFNNDSYPDLFLTSDGSGFYSNGNPAYTPDRLLANRGDGKFVDVTESSGLPIHLTSHFASTWVDYDNDGWLDLAAHNRFFRNLKNGAFEEITGPVGINLLNYPHGIVSLDADGDGALDLYYGTMNQNQLYMSSGSIRNWLKVNLQDAQPGHHCGYGAQIRISNTNGNIYEYPVSSTGWGDQGACIQHVGTGTDDRLDVRIQWLSGIVDEIFDVEANTTLSISEGDYQDDIPPEAISNLVAVGVSEQSVILSWSAPGDDEDIRMAAGYEIRMSNSPIDTNSWNSAILLQESPDPVPPKTRQVWAVDGLAPDTQYYFALKAYDEAGNIAPISNVAETKTLLGEKILNFTATVFGMTRIDLSWKVPFVLISSYDIRYSTEIIHEGNFDQAQAITDIPEAGYPGDHQSTVVEGLNSGTTYYFAIKMILADGSRTPISDVISAKTLNPITNSLPVVTTITPEYEGTLGSTPFSTGDINGDGNPDLIIAQQRNINDQIQYEVVIHLSSNGFISQSPSVIMPGADFRFAAMQGIAISDLNNDGYDDLIVGKYKDQATGSKQGQVFIYLGRDVPQNSPDHILYGTISDGCFGQAVLGGKDFNGDHIDDLVVYEFGLLNLYWGVEGGILSDTPDMQLSYQSPGSDYFVTLSAGDINGDGFQDILASYSSNVGIFFADNYGSFLTVPQILSSRLGALYPEMPIIGDFNADDADDIVISTMSDPSPHVVDIYFGEADIDWSLATPSLTITDSMDGNNAIAAIDLNADGNDDLLVGDEEDQTFYDGVLRVFLGGADFDNINDKEIAVEGRFDFGEYLCSMGDLNNDGYNDILVGDPYGDKDIYILNGEQISPRIDFIPPAPVIDLLAVTDSVESVTLSWTAPGDDGMEGRAAQYEILYTAHKYGFEGSWGQYANYAANVPLPSERGSAESLQVEGLVPGLTYRFVMRTWDEAGNVSDSSNEAEIVLPVGYDFIPKFQFNQSNGANGNCITLLDNMWSSYDAGDINGDGIDDLLLNGGDMCGRVRVFWGNPFFEANPDFDLIGNDTWAQDLNGDYGYVNRINSGVPMGDYNNDGNYDFYVHYSTYYNESFYTGSSNLFLVNPNGKLNNSEWGYPKVVGDVNGDGNDDYVVGTSLFLGASSFGNTPDFVLYQDNDVSSVTGIGDINNDGYDDIAIGTIVKSNWANDQMNYYGSARVLVYLGGADFDGDSNFEIAPPAQELGDIASGLEVAHEFGKEVIGIGDWNGDGYSDIAVTAESSDVRFTQAGAVYIYFGGQTCRETPDVTLYGLTPYNELGLYLYSLGDINGDGFDDFMARGSSLSGTNGEIGHFVYLGGLQPSGRPSFVIMNDNPDHPDMFDPYTSQIRQGIDFNGDGKNELIWNGKRHVSTGTVYLIDLAEQDTDNDGVFDSVDPFVNNGSPSSISITTPLDGQINIPPNSSLSWSAVDPDDDALIYDVYLGITSDPSILAVGITDNELDLACMPLDYNTFYYWRVVAKDSLGQSVSSPVHSFVTSAPPVPQTPIDINISGNPEGNLISWNQPEDAVSCQVIIERRDSIDAEWETLAEIDDMSNMYLDNVYLQPHKSYFYRIALRNVSGPSPYSESISVTSFNEIPEIQKPYKFVFDTCTDNTQQLMASNQDEDNLTWSTTNGPQGIFIDGSSGMLHWVPEPSQLGEHVVEISVNDGAGGTSTATITINVLDKIAPQIEPPVDISTRTVSEPVPLDLGVPAVADLVSDSENIIISNNAPIDGFSIGNTQVVWTAVDEAGNISVTSQNVNVTRKLYGDINDNGTVNLKDAIMALQIITGIEPADAYYIEADVNGDGKIGLSEAVYILQQLGSTGEEG